MSVFVPYVGLVVLAVSQLFALFHWVTKVEKLLERLTVKFEAISNTLDKAESRLTEVLNMKPRLEAIEERVLGLEDREREAWRHESK